MPDLPTITVTAEQASRMLAAYGDTATYRTWLRRQVVEYVVAAEQNRMQGESLEAQRAATAATRAQLDPPPTA